MTLRTLLEKFFLLCGVAALVILVGTADSLSYAVLIPLGIALWVVYIWMEYRARKAALNKPAVWIRDASGVWRTIDGTNREHTGPKPPRNSIAIYDQDA